VSLLKLICFFMSLIIRHYDFTNNVFYYSGFHFLPLSWHVVNTLHDWAEENESKIPFVEAEIGSVYWYAEGYGTAGKILVSGGRK